MSQHARTKHPAGSKGKNLTQKALLNGFAAILDYGARLAVGFVINPLMVTFLGSYGYGAWRILERLIGYISPASGRPTQALQWTIAKQQSSDDHLEKRRQVASALMVWVLFLPLSLFFGGLLVWFAPRWLNVPADLGGAVRVAAALLVANLSLISLVNIPRSVLQGENLGYKRMGLTTFLVFLGGGLTALALYLHTGLVGVAAATLASTLLTGALYLQVVYAQVPWFGVARPRAGATRQFLGLSGWFLGWNLVMKLMMASDIVVLGIFNSVDSVATYSLTKYTPEMLVSLVAMVVFGITPGLGGIIGSGNLQKAARVRSEIMLLTWLIGTALGASVLAWNGIFVPLWVGERFYAGALPTLLMTVMMLQFTFIRNDANIIDLTLELRNKVLLGLLSAGLALGLAILGLKVFNLGVVGLCSAFILGRLVLSVAYPLFVGRLLGISPVAQWRAVFRPGAVTVLLFSGALWSSSQLHTTNWFVFLASGAGTLVLTLLLAFLLGLSGVQRARLLERTRRVVQRG